MTPAEDDLIHCTLYHREPGLQALAEAELYALGGGASAEPGVWLSPRPIRWASCGYGSAGGRQLAFAPTLDGLEASLRSLRLVAPRFCITARCLPRFYPGSSDARRRVADCIEGAVSFDAPDLRLLLLVSRAGYRVLIEERAAPREAAWLAASGKPHNYLVALPVRIARAVLNITLREGDSVLDPFCGSGTIPLLAAWAGHRSFGSDVSAACVEHAAVNLDHFELAAVLACVDARETRQRADCIVTNLPYGLYSHVAVGALPEILSNLVCLAPCQTFVTSARIEQDLHAAGYELARVLMVESGRFERFVYVTRAPAAGASRSSEGSCSDEA